MEKAFGLTIPRTLDDVCNPRDMALLVYDMQVGIVSQVSDGAALTARVHDVLTIAREAGMRVCFTRHLSLPREFMGSFQYRMAMSWQRIDSPDEVRRCPRSKERRCPLRCVTVASARSRSSALPWKSASSPPPDTLQISASFP
jgi:hypothetical protein